MKRTFMKKTEASSERMRVTPTNVGGFLVVVGFFVCFLIWARPPLIFSPLLLLPPNKSVK